MTEIARGLIFRDFTDAECDFYDLDC